MLAHSVSPCRTPTTGDVVVLRESYPSGFDWEVLVALPETYTELDTVAREVFHIRPGLEVCFTTDTLDVCNGRQIELHRSCWNLVRRAVQVITVRVVTNGFKNVPSTSIDCQSTYTSDSIEDTASGHSGYFSLDVNAGSERSNPNVDVHMRGASIASELSDDDEDAIRELKRSPASTSTEVGSTLSMNVVQTLATSSLLTAGDWTRTHAMIPAPWTMMHLHRAFGAQSFTPVHIPGPSSVQLTGWRSNTSVLGKHKLDDAVSSPADGTDFVQSALDEEDEGPPALTLGHKRRRLTE